MDANIALNATPKPKHSYTKALIITQIAIYVFIILHSIAWHVFGIHTISKLCPFVFGDEVANLEFNWSVVFWILAFSSTLIVGRAFCAWGCMFGAFQDAMYRLSAMLKLKPTKRKWGVWLTRFATFLIILTIMIGGSQNFWGSIYWHVGIVLAVGVIIWLLVERKEEGYNITKLPKYLYTGQYLGAIVVTWVSLNVFQTGITLAFDKYGVLHNMDKSWPFLLGEVILIGVAIMFVEKRVFCKYLCPIGLFFRFFAAIPFLTKYKVRATEIECLKCGKCDRACLMGISPMKDVIKFGQVKDPNCINCLECVSNCPKNAIEFAAGEVK